MAMQTIKSIAQRRWRDDDPEKHFSWYRPIRDPEALKRAVDFVLTRPGLFLNTSSDASLFDSTMTAADAPIEPLDADVLAADVQVQGLEPLFVRDVSDDVRLEQ